MCLINFKCRSFALSAILISLLTLSSSAYAKPATIDINMNNKLKESVQFNFHFANDYMGYYANFEPGESFKSVPIRDDQFISPKVTVSYVSKKTGHDYPCNVDYVKSDKPRTFIVTIEDFHFCHLTLTQ